MADIEKEIEVRFHKWLTLFNNGDAAGLADLYADDCRVLPPGGETVGKEAVVGMMQHLFETGWKKATLEKPEYQAMGSEFAFASGKWIYSNKDDEVVARMKDMTIWRKKGETWKIYRDVFNSDT